MIEAATQRAGLRSVDIWKAALLSVALSLGACDRPAALAWSWSGDAPSRSGLVALEGDVVLGNEAGEVVRLGGDGAPRWRAPVGREVAARPAVVGDMVVAVTLGGEWIGVAASDGTPRWRFAHRPVVRLALAADAQRAFALADDGSVTAILGASGATAWSREPPLRDVAGLGAPPVIAHRHLLVALGPEGLHALRPDDGELAWRQPLGTVIGLCTDGERVYGLTRERTLFAVRSVDGGSEWRRELREEVLSGPTLARGLLWIGLASDGLLAIDPADGNEVWRTLLPAGLKGGVSEYRELILVPTHARQGRLLAFRVGESDPVFTVRADSALRTTPRVVGDRVLALASDGRVLAWDIRRTTR